MAYLAITNLTTWGWRGLFALSILPALLSLFVRAKVTESEAWEETRENVKRNNTTIRDIVRSPLMVRRFVYLILLMTAFN